MHQSPCCPSACAWLGMGQAAGGAKAASVFQERWRFGDKSFESQLYQLP